MPTFDYLIVGQGLAGSLLGYRLLRQGATVGFLDAPEQTAASSVAAGIINPITGRYYTKSWQIEVLLPAARTLYQALEQELGERFYYEWPLYRALLHAGHLNDWDARRADAAYTSYLGEVVRQLPNAPPAVAAVPAYARVRQSAQVDVGRLVSALRQRWQAEERWRGQTIDYRQLQVATTHCAYDDWRAERVVFCEGWRVRDNPYFSYLPCTGNKGEALIVHLPQLDWQQIVKHRVFVVPLGHDHYWIGATNENQFADETPTERNGQYLHEQLSQWLHLPYTVVAHRAAVRPTVRDRRPLLGVHPDWPRLFIFNGLGTKGASLAPYWSAQMSDFLLRDQALDPAVDIRRYAPPDR